MKEKPKARTEKKENETDRGGEPVTPKWTKTSPACQQIPEKSTRQSKGKCNTTGEERERVELLMPNKTESWRSVLSLRGPSVATFEGVQKQKGNASAWREERGKEGSRAKNMG